MNRASFLSPLIRVFPHVNQSNEKGPELLPARFVNHGDRSMLTSSLHSELPIPNSAIPLHSDLPIPNSAIPLHSELPIPNSAIPLHSEFVIPNSEFIVWLSP